MQNLNLNGEVQNDHWQLSSEEASSEKESQAKELASTIVAISELSSGQKAVVIQPDEQVEALGEQLAQLELIAINFPAFADGRGFSHARKLRDEFGFKGDIRAVGNFMQDQLHYLKRCGFSSFELKGEVDTDSFVQSLGDFSNAYQAACDQPKPLFRRR